MKTFMRINYQTMTHPKKDEKDSIFISNRGLIRKPNGFSNLTTDPHNITLERAKEIHDKIFNQKEKLREGEYIEWIKFDLSTYKDYKEVDGVLHPILPTDINQYDFEFEAKRINKTATYYPKTNVLDIYEDGEFVYQNYNGEISKGEV